MNDSINEIREEQSIDIVKLLLHYLHHWWLILAAAVVCGALVAAYTWKFVTPTYTASVTMYVNNIKSDESIDSISSGNLSASKSLVNTYISIIKSDTIMEKVIETIQQNSPDFEVTAAKLKSWISAQQVNDTEIFRLCVTHSDPMVAAAVCNQVAVVSIGELERIVEGSSAKIIDDAKAPDPNAPSSPNYKKNILLGCLGGAAAVVIFLTIQFLMDVEIKDAEELEQVFHVAVLGQIPDFTQTMQKRGYSYKKHQAEKNGYGYAYTPHKEEELRAEDTAEQPDNEKKGIILNRKKGGKQ